MTTYAAEDYEAIRRRQEEIKAERDLALTGSTVHIQHDAATGETLEHKVGVGDYAMGWPMTAAADYDPA